MKLSDFEKVAVLRTEYSQLTGEVNGATIEVSFNTGRIARVPIDKQLGKHYAEQARADARRKLQELGVEA